MTPARSLRVARSRLTMPGARSPPRPSAPWQWAQWRENNVCPEGCCAGASGVRRVKSGSSLRWRERVTRSMIAYRVCGESREGVGLSRLDWCSGRERRGGGLVGEGRAVSGGSDARKAGNAVLSQCGLIWQGERRAGGRIGEKNPCVVRLWRCVQRGDAAIVSRVPGRRRVGGRIEKSRALSGCGESRNAGNTAFPSVVVARGLAEKSCDSSTAGLHHGAPTMSG